MSRESSTPDGSDEFIARCCGEADREVRSSANRCMARNAARDPAKPKWARVPAGDETCPECIMLASRGFAYNSYEAAEHSHPNCDCVIVASHDKSNPAVQGYDPDEYLDRYKHPEIYKGLDPVTTRSLACLRVAEKRGQVVYEKPLLSFLKKEEDRRDLVAHAALARAGKRFTALAEDAPEGYSNIDLLMDGKKWEVKSPHKSNPRAVETRLRAAKDQFEKNYPEPIEEVRVVFNGYFYGQSDEFVASKIAQEGDRHGITEVIHVDKSGKLAETWKARTTSPDRPGLQTGHSIAHAASSTEEHRSPKPTTEVRPLGGVPDGIEGGGTTTANGRTQELRVNWPSISASVEEIAANSHDFIGPEQWQPKMTVIQMPTGSTLPKDYSLLSGKGRRKLKDNETASHDLFESYGFEPIALPEDRSASANIDLIMTVNGETHYWELKDPEKGDRAQKKLTSEGVSKWRRIQDGVAPEIIEIDELGTPRIAIDNRFNDWQSDHDAIRRLANDMAYYEGSGFDEAILVLKDGTIVHFER